MKKVLLLATLFAVFSLGMSAQAFEYVPLDANTGRPLVPSVPSVPSTPSIQSYGFGAPTPQTSQVSVVGGYVKAREDERLVRVKLRVCSMIGQTLGPYVLAVYNLGTGQWVNNTTRARKILPMDGQFLADNFEWAAHTSLYGIVYFNY